LQQANYLVKKAQERQNKIVFSSLGKPEDLMIYEFSDVSYNTDTRSVGGQIIMLGNVKNDCVTQLLWKTKIIKKVYRSSKDAELLSLSTLFDYSIHLGKQLEEIIFNVRDGSKYKPVLFCDNALTLESVVSSKLVERRYLRPDVEIVKQLLENKEVSQIRWIPDELQIHTGLCLTT
jgi:predicted metal-binding transcription factor (methanogenesis marker protein 9)